MSSQVSVRAGQYVTGVGTIGERHDEWPLLDRADVLRFSRRPFTGTVYSGRHRRVTLRGVRRWLKARAR